MSKIVLQGYIVIPDADLELVRSELANHIRLTRAEKGCLIFEVTEDPNNKNRYHVYEQFMDQTSFSLHQERVDKSVWGRVTNNVERHYTISEV